MYGPRIPLHDPGSVGLSSERLDRIDGLLHALVDGGYRPNAMVMVGRHGKPVYCRGVGAQNSGNHGSLAEGAPRPLRQDSIFRIYSMTKPITSVALMMLFEEGRFLLSDPIWLYLGDAWKKKNMRTWKSGFPKHGNVVTEACDTSITIMHVLTHTSGLSYGFDQTGLLNPVDGLYLEAKVALERYATVADFADALARIPLLFQPGRCWHYGYNTDICGLLVERISGMSLADFFQRRIFGPLGMVDTAFWVPKEKRHRFCDNFWELPEPKEGKGIQGRLWNISSKTSNANYTRDGPPTLQSGGGGLVSTIHDYMRFCLCMLNGGELDGQRLLSVKTVEFMSLNHLPQNKDMLSMPPPLGETYTETRAPGDGFGLGFSVKTNNTASGHIGSDGILFWGGAADTAFWLDPQEDLFCIWMTQLMGADAQRMPVREKLRSLVYASVVDRRPFQPQLRARL